MAQIPCPVADQYLAVLTGYMEEAGWHLYNDLVDDFTEVVERAKENHPNLLSLRLRGFYLVEVLYHSILPRTSIPRTPSDKLRTRPPEKAGMASLDTLAEGGQTIQMIESWRYPRSTEGLNELLENLQGLREDTEVEDIALDLDGRVAPAVRSMRGGMVEPWHKALNATEKAATELRRLLVPTDVNSSRWTAMGRYFAEGCLDTSEEMEECLKHARRILSTTPDTPVSPWTLQPSYQE